MWAWQPRPLRYFNGLPARQGDYEGVIVHGRNLAEWQGTLTFKNGLAILVETQVRGFRVANEPKPRCLRLDKKIVQRQRAGWR